MAYAIGEKWRNTGSGAVSGAGTGSAIGSLIPGVGSVIGGGIGALLGGIGGYLFTDDEKNEMIESYRAGRLDPQTVANIESTIARRYAMLRRGQNAQLARRGIDQSSFAGRQIAGTFNDERSALAQALTNQVAQRQQIGFGMSDAASAQRAQNVASGIGAAFQGYQLHQENQFAQQQQGNDAKLHAAIGKYLGLGTSSSGGVGGGTATPAAVTGGGTTATTATTGSGTAAKKLTGGGTPTSRQRSRHPNVKNPFLPQNRTLDQIFGRVK